MTPALAKRLDTVRADITKVSKSAKVKEIGLKLGHDEPDITTRLGQVYNLISEIFKAVTEIKAMQEQSQYLEAGEASMQLANKAKELTDLFSDIGLRFKQRQEKE